MIFYPNQNTNLFTRSIGLASVVRTATFKARDCLTLDVVFHDGSVAEDLPDDSRLVFILKPGFATNAPVYAMADNWEKVATGSYRSTLNLNTESLVGDIGSLTKISAFAELSWSADGVSWESSNTVDVTIDNDLYKGSEGTPVVFPDADAWLQARIGPLALNAPPMDGVLEVRQVIAMDFYEDGTSHYIGESGTVNLRYPGGDHYNEFSTVELTLEAAEGNPLFQVYDQLVTLPQLTDLFDISLSDDEHSILFTLKSGGSILPYDYGAMGWGIPVGTINDYSLPLGRSGPPPVPGTLGTVARPGRLAITTMPVSGRIVSFRAIAEFPMKWEGATPGLLWDSAPATGLPRWKIIEFTGEGDARTTTYSEL